MKELLPSRDSWVAVLVPDLVVAVSLIDAIAAAGFCKRRTAKTATHMRLLNAKNIVVIAPVPNVKKINTKPNAKGGASPRTHVGEEMEQPTKLLIRFCQKSLFTAAWIR